MNRLFTFWLSHRQELAVMLSQHILLVAASTFAAIAIGIALQIRTMRYASDVLTIIAMAVARAKNVISMPSPLHACSTPSGMSST